MRIVLLTIDGLHIGYLGCYGNAWVGTPALDRLATESVVLDRLQIDSPQPQLCWRSLWHGIHAMANPDERVESQAPLPESWKATRGEVVLVTDEPELPGPASAWGFEVLDAPPNVGAAGSAEDVSGTRMAALFNRAIEQLAGSDEDVLLWMHSRGMQAEWDAPMALRRQYVEDENDPDPPEWTQVPRLTLDADFDPDELLGLRWAYAAQVNVFDRCLGAFWQTVERQGWDEETLLVVLSTRGFPLGEHGVVGLSAPLHEELVHVPCWIRMPNGDYQGERLAALCQPGDVCATLVDAAGLDGSEFAPHGQSLLAAMQGDPSMLPDRAGTIGWQRMQGSLGEFALRTDYWYARFPGATAAGGGNGLQSVQLYAKPDDRWEQNEVAALCPQEATAMAAALAGFQADIAGAGRRDYAPLEACLRHRNR